MNFFQIDCSEQSNKTIISDKSFLWRHTLQLYRWEVFRNFEEFFLEKRNQYCTRTVPGNSLEETHPVMLEKLKDEDPFSFSWNSLAFQRKRENRFFFPLFFCVCGSFDCSLDQPKDYPQAHSKSLNYCLLVQCLFSLIQVSVTVGKLLNFAIFNVRLFSILCSKTILVHSIRTHQIWLNASQIFSGIRCVPGTILIRSGTCTLKIMYYIIL